MKHCATLAASPAGLTEFRDANPGERSWEVFRNEHWEAYKALALALEMRQRGLCAFCESHLVTPVPTPARQVEHWQPKGLDETPTADWTFGVENMHACCLGGTKRHLPPPFGTAGIDADKNLSCGQLKGERDPNSIDLELRPYRPTELPLSPAIFAVNLEGLVTPSQEALAAGLEKARIEATITFLGLNCERLSIARAEVRQYLDGVLEEYIASAPGEDEVERTAHGMTQLAKELAVPKPEKLPAFVSVLRDFFGPDLEKVLLPDADWSMGS